MKLSIIIPVKPGRKVAALPSLLALQPSHPDFEVIIAEGLQPSRQRNAAVERSSGEVLYFLDDDSMVASDALVRLEKHFMAPGVTAVGGPSLTPLENTPLQQAIAWALASVLGGGGVRNRYRQHGSVRETGDRELILCNLAMRRQAFLNYGGLDERLYPNEENKLIDAMVAQGEKLLHDPELYVYRNQRPTVKAFIRQMTVYGRGRGEQSLLAGTISFKPMLPALFFCYLLVLPFVLNWMILIPGLVYAIAVTATTVDACLKGRFALARRLPLVYPLLHLAYGAGFLIGIIAPRYKRRKGTSGPVTLKVVKAMGAEWPEKISEYVHPSGHIT